MWADFLIAAGLAILLGVGVTVLVQRGGGKAERRRTRAIADASGARHEPLAEGEQEHAEEMRALAEEHRTGEQRIVRKQQHLTSVTAIARRYARKPKHAKAKLPKSKRFDPLTSPLSGPLEKPVMLPDRQPQPWDLESFTGEWNAGSQFVRPLNGSRR
jgi:hypothetical protein